MHKLWPATIADPQLIVGIGSPNGADCLGWQIAERLASRWPACTVRCALVPLDLLDWLDQLERLLIIDALMGCDEQMCHYSPELDILWQGWQWPEARAHFEPQRRSTHGYDLMSVLELAEVIAKVPAVTWIIGVCPYSGIRKTSQRTY